MPGDQLCTVLNLRRGYVGRLGIFLLVALNRDQFFRVEKGKGEVVIDGQRSQIKADDAIIVPAGARHNIMNTGGKPLRLQAFAQGFVTGHPAMPQGQLDPCRIAISSPISKRSPRIEAERAG